MKPSWRGGYIYCSSETAKILPIFVKGQFLMAFLWIFKDFFTILGLKADLIRPLELDQTHVISLTDTQTMNVTVLEVSLKFF